MKRNKKQILKHAQRHFNKGQALQNRCLWRWAIPEYTKALKLNPEFVDAYLCRALCYAFEGILKKAMRDYNQAIKLDPKCSDVYAARAHFHFQYTEDNNKAILDYNRAIKLDPQNGSHYESRAEVYAENRLYVKAIRDYSRAIKWDREFVDAKYCSVAQIHLCKGNFQKAISYFTRAIAISKFCLHYNRRGHVYMTIGDYDKAISDYSTAIRLDPKKAYDHRGRVIGRRPAGAYYYCNRGGAYQHKGEYQKAMKDMTKAIFVEPKSYQRYAYVFRGFLYFEMKDYKNAMRDFSAAYKEYWRRKRQNYYVEKEPLAYVGLAITYYRTGKLYKAKTFLKTAVRLARKSGRTVHRLAKDYFLAKPALQAIRELEKTF